MSLCFHLGVCMFNKNNHRSNNQCFSTALRQTHTVLPLDKAIFKFCYLEELVEVCVCVCGMGERGGYIHRIRF